MVTVNLSAPVNGAGVELVVRDLDRALGEFFHEHSGTVGSWRRTDRRKSQEQRPAAGTSCMGLTVHVEFANLGLFGTSAEFLADIYPRIRHLNTSLQQHLRGDAVSDCGPLASLVPAIMPFPGEGGYLGRALPREPHFSRGESIVHISELAVHNDHWRHVMDEYRANWVCITNHGTVVGPDASLLAVARAVADTSASPLRVYEFGSGTGTLATMLHAQGRLASYEGVDYSHPMVDHFETRVRPGLEHVRGRVAVDLGSCFESALPAASDLVCVAVYYQAQPSLMRRRGEEIARCLGDSGVLMAQTGTLEDPLVTRLLAGPSSDLQRWPWYDPGFSLRTWFHHVCECVVEEQAVVLASNDEARLSTIRERLSSVGRHG